MKGKKGRKGGKGNANKKDERDKGERKEKKKRVKGGGEGLREEKTEKGIFYLRNNIHPHAEVILS